MPITTQCTIQHGMIRLPANLGLIDGMKVLVNIEPVTTKASKKVLARKLAGSWNDDSSIGNVFNEIDKERHSYFGRDIEIKA
ncbi:MAG: hypothetical protein FIA89_09605 [Geobacter sp.]|nr:hypothetical protein [Geobacter sp.]